MTLDLEERFVCVRPTRLRSVALKLHSGFSDGFFGGGGSNCIKRVLRVSWMDSGFRQVQGTVQL